MTPARRPTFTRRQNRDGSCEVICHSCLATVAWERMDEDSRGVKELQHQCDPIRVYQASQGVIPRPFLGLDF